MRRNLLTTIIFLLVVLMGGIGCQPDQAYKANTQDPEVLTVCMKRLTEIIIYDIFSPPVASRIYAYPAIAAYEVLRQDNPEYITLAGQIRDFEEVPAPDTTKEISYPLAAVHAFIQVADQLVFSRDKIIEFQEEMHNYYRERGVPNDVFKNSLAYGEEVAQHVLAYSSGDNYKQTRTFPRYTVNDDSERWRPTPPDYMDAIEPHWNKIRTFIIDSATQFVPVPPTEFNLDKNSKFYEELMEVYDVGLNLTPEQKAIAEFWDCNPFVTHHQGHVMFATKKITPGGHWIGITGIACRAADADIMRTAEAYAHTSLALFDAFVSCWDEKFRSNLVRPETVINQHIDEEWRPLLQTPPFPEYTSGHSVISTAAAVTLTNLFGEPFPFVDSTEVDYGLPTRSFNSFLEASQEAAISRLYGGIHYRPACFIGVEQGEKVGRFVVAHLKTREGMSSTDTAAYP
jgi:hypothetical protein